MVRAVPGAAHVHHRGAVMFDLLAAVRRHRRRTEISWCLTVLARLLS